MLIIEQTESDKLTLLKQAIENKVEVSFWYKGVGFRDPKNKKYNKQNWRFVQPTDLGKSKATDKWMLRAYQVGGVSNTNQKAWKTFLVDEMSSITVMDGEDGGYKPFDKPTGSNFNLSGDKKMKNDKPELKIDINKKPAPNKKIQNNVSDNNEINENRSFLKWIIKIGNGCE